MDDIKGIVDHLKSMLPMEPLGVRAAGEKFKAQLSPLPDDFARRIDRAVAELERQEQQVIKLYPAPIVTAAKQARWYLGPTESSSPNWSAYRENLERKGWGAGVIQSIDRASTKITNELLCPNGSREDRFQGLVLGYVQSGKTASMAGTIAKAADSGYRMVIVLAGMTNVLRQQTQIRLLSDVVNHNPSLWLEGTTVESDFKPGSVPKLPVVGRGKCSLFVVKKNAAVLRRLKKAQMRRARRYRQAPRRRLRGKCSLSPRPADVHLLLLGGRVPFGPGLESDRRHQQRNRRAARGTRAGATLPPPPRGRCRRQGP